MDKIKILQRKIKIDFKNEKILLQAITHKSFDPNNNYENLEFLGDRVLGLVVSKKLFEIFPNEKVGSLDKKLASLVNKNKCLEVGNLLNLKEFVITGNSKSSRNIVENKIISDCCEAIIGAIYLDRGFEVSKIFILKQWKNLINNAETTFVDAKTRLQEYSLKNFKILPTYKLISNTGPRHKPIFKVGVKLPNTKYFIASGNSKKDAEQNAAIECLKNINYTGVNFDDEEEIFKFINNLKLVYEDFWKSQNQINTSVKLSLNISIDNSNNIKINKFEKILSNMDLIYNSFIYKFDNQNNYYKVIFNGTPDKFLEVMSYQNYYFEIKNKIWVLNDKS